MRRFIFFFTIASVLLSARPGHAIDTRRTYRVSVEGKSAGSWRFRSRVEDTGLACRYTFYWASRCRLDELKAGSAFDCEEARRRGVATGIVLVSGEGCEGRDDFGQDSEVLMLAGGESSSGRINALVMFASIGDTAHLTARPR